MSHAYELPYSVHQTEEAVRDDGMVANRIWESVKCYCDVLRLILSTDEISQNGANRRC